MEMTLDFVPRASRTPELQVAATTVWETAREFTRNVYAVLYVGSARGDAQISAVG